MLRVDFSGEDCINLLEFFLADDDEMAVLSVNMTIYAIGFGNINNENIE